MQLICNADILLAVDLLCEHTRDSRLVWNFHLVIFLCLHGVRLLVSDSFEKKLFWFLSKWLFRMVDFNFMSTENLTPSHVTPQPPRRSTSVNATTSAPVAPIFKVPSVRIFKKFLSTTLQWDAMNCVAWCLFLQCRWISSFDVRGDCKYEKLTDSWVKE